MVWQYRNARDVSRLAVPRQREEARDQQSEEPFSADFAPKKEGSVCAVDFVKFGLIGHSCASQSPVADRSAPPAAALAPGAFHTSRTTRKRPAHGARANEGA